MAGHLHSRDIPGAEDPEAKKFFNNELNRKLKEYLILGAIAGIVTGFANGIQKQILGTLSPGAYVITSPLLSPPVPPANT
jgi:hypothetical protein